MTQKSQEEYTYEDFVLARSSALGWCRLVTKGWKPYPYLVEMDWHLNRALTGEGPRVVVIEAPPQFGKCIRLGGLIWTNRGIVQAGDIVLGDQVASLRDGQLVWNSVTGISRSMRRAVCVKTRTGRELFVSPEHRMLTQSGYIEAGKLLPGQDFLISVHGEIEDSYFRYDMITEVEFLGQEEEMVDLEVARDANFILEGVVSHNSSFANIGWPSWLFGSNPSLKIAVASYNQNLSSEFTIKSRDAFEEYGREVFGLELRKDYQARDAWMVEGHTGSVRGVGVGGSLSGFQVHVLIVDDPYKSMEDALSPARREKVWQWYTSVGSTRMAKESLKVIIHTRWHSDDLIGRLKMHALERPNEFAIVSFPVFATQDEVMHDGVLFRRKGDLLCPDLHPLEQINELKATLSNYEFSALYQQQPIQPDGTYWAEEIFQDAFITQMPAVPNFLVVGIDTSMGRDQVKADFVAAVAVATNNDGKFYVDSWIGKKSPTVACQEIAKWMKTLPRTPDAIGTDMAGYQELYAESLATEFAAQNIVAPLVPVDHEGVEKRVRIQRLDPILWHRMIRFLTTRSNVELINQLKGFPRTDVHDDGPDALEMAFRILGDVGNYL